MDKLVNLCSLCIATNDYKPKGGGVYSVLDKLMIIKIKIRLRSKGS